MLRESGKVSLNLKFYQVLIWKSQTQTRSFKFIVGEERAFQLETELANVHQEMQEQENEAMNAINKWQQSAAELEEKCAELEEDLKNALVSEDSVDAMNDPSHSEYSKLKEENASLRKNRKKIDHLETTSVGTSGSQSDSEPPRGDTILELREALNIAHDTLARDEEVVQQWEGK
jgi:DNA repair exonuclease SbcCD ATPase subunit